MTGSSAAQATAECFLAARKAATGLADYPGTLPTSLEEGYAIQDAALARVTDAVAGWKVGRIASPLSETFGSDRLAGPIFASTVFVADEKSTGLIFAQGFGAVEAEFLFRLSAAPPVGKTSFTLEDAAELVDAVHIGIEIASSPLGAINTLGPAVTISDFGNNNGLLIGPGISDWRDDSYATIPVTTRIDGVEVGSGTVAAFNNGAIGSVRFLIENLVARGIAIQPGWWISTGAVTGVHQAHPGQVVETDFGPLGCLHCTMTAQEPR